jgi:hypothetical protein
LISKEFELDYLDTSLLFNSVSTDFPNSKISSFWELAKLCLLLFYGHFTGVLLDMMHE